MTCANTRCGLSLLELLGVIVVFAILWAFVFPATDSVRRNTLRRLASADVQSLASAVLLYRDSYGHWPLNPTNSEDVVFIVDNIDRIDTQQVDIRSQADFVSAISRTNEVWNPNAIRFLEMDPSRVVNGYFVDPWSTTNSPSAYVVALDSNGDGWIGIRDEDTSGTSSVGGIEIRRGDDAHRIPPVRSPVYIFSWTNGDTNRVEAM